MSAKPRRRITGEERCLNTISVIVRFHDPRQIEAFTPEGAGKDPHEAVAAEQLHTLHRGRAVIARVFIDCFDEGLSDLPGRKQRDMHEVALHLAKAGRFSVSEATANQDIARTITQVLRAGWLETNQSYGYPWTKVELNDLGQAHLLGLGEATAPRGAG